MESRDLPSSSPSSTANRDASSATDADDGVFTVAVSFAKEAALHFQSGKYAECAEILNKLLQKKQDDPKRKNDELALALGEQGESGNNVGNKVALGSKGSNASAHQFSVANSTGIMYTDDFDSSVAMLNIGTKAIRSVKNTLVNTGESQFKP